MRLHLPTENHGLGLDEDHRSEDILLVLEQESPVQKQDQAKLEQLKEEKDDANNKPTSRVTQTMRSNRAQ